MVRFMLLRPILLTVNYSVYAQAEPKWRIEVVEDLHIFKRGLMISLPGQDKTVEEKELGEIS